MGGRRKASCAGTTEPRRSWSSFVHVGSLLSDMLFQALPTRRAETWRNQRSLDKGREGGLTTAKPLHINGDIGE
jgi:hypothetical protein